MTRARSLLVVALCVAGAVGGVPAHATPSCTGDPTVAQSLTLGSGATGQYVAPANTPTAIAVFAHGYSHKSDSWVAHMKRTAAEGALAVAMDYRGTYHDGSQVRGWFVKEGAQDSNDVAQLFLGACGLSLPTILYGVSMGGNTSGLAVAAKAQRVTGDALWDYWVAGEPAANVIETYHEASLVAQTGSEFVVNARDDIEQEFGGTFAEQPQAYLDGTVVARVPDIAASAIKGVAIVHGFDDGLVPYNQARELATALRAAGVVTDFYNAARRETGGTACGTDNTTLTENVGAPLSEGATGDCYAEPLAGHSTESSDTSLVVQTGLDVVFDLIHGASIPGGHEFVVDGEAGVVPIA